MLHVLTESPRAFRDTRRFFLSRMLRRAGLPHRPVGPRDPLDLAAPVFVHVNLTHVPGDWLARAVAAPRSVNARAASIDRRLFSTARLMPDDAYDGPVIVKTVLNKQGVPELRHSLRQSSVGRLKRLAYRTLWRRRWAELTRPYRMFLSLEEVPLGVWRDEALIVERFVPGSLEPPIVKHRWDFFLDVSLVTRSVFGTPLCEPTSFIEVSEEDTPPAELVALREKLGVEFGSIDYFVTAEGPVAIDVNKTTTADDEWIEAFPFVARYLAEGSERLRTIAGEAP